MLEKIKFYFYFCFASICSFLALKEETIIILTVLIFLDIITGIIKNIRLGKDIKSRICVIGIMSKLLMILVPMIIALVGKGVGFDLGVLVIFTFSMFIISEGYSVISNIGVAITKKDFGEYDAVSNIFSLILDSFKKFLENGFNGFKKN